MPEDERMGVKSVRAAMMILIIGSGVVGFAQSSESPSNETLEQWEMFKEKYGENWQVRWHSDRNVPKKIFGSVYQTDVTEIRNKGTAESVVKGFLVDNKELLKINPSELKLSRVRDGWNVEYQQYYSDIPVYGGRVGATITGDGRIIGIGNNFYPGINISTEPKITKKEAVKIVLKQKNPGTTVNEAGEVINGTRLYIVPKTEDGNIIYHLTWRVPTHTALYFINAEDSSVVLRVQTMFPSGGGTVSGGSIASAVSSLKYVAAVILFLTLIIIWRFKK